jgi:hypothetical protein
MMVTRDIFRATPKDLFMNSPIDADTFLKGATAALSKKGKTAYRGSIARATAVFPVHVLAGVEAISEYSSLTRSKVIAMLTETGLRLVVEHFGPEAAEEVAVLTELRMRALLSGPCEQGDV